MGVMVQSLQAQQRSVHGKQAKDLVLQTVNISTSLENKYISIAMQQHFFRQSASQMCTLFRFQTPFFGLVGLICQVDIPLKTC